MTLEMPLWRQSCTLDEVQQENCELMEYKSSLMVALLLLSATAVARTNKLSPELRKQSDGGSVNVIVQFKTSPRARHHQKVLSRGGQLRQHLGLVKGGAYTVPATALADLAKDPEVAYVSLDRGLQGFSDNGSSSVLDYHNETLNTSYGWGLNLDGTGIGVAVLDSGIVDIVDLHASSGGSRIVYSQSFIGNANGSANDQYGHGSHVAGIVAGNGKKSSQNKDFYTFSGIAPNVNLVNLRVLDQNGMGTDSGVIAAIQTAISLKSHYNIRVMNLSLGRPVYESYTLDPLCQAVEAAYKAGIVVVVSAGNLGRDNSNNNSGYGTITAPGNDPYVITVGAMKSLGTQDRSDDLIATYSSKGPTAIDHIAKPDLVAPGNLIISLYSPAVQLNKIFPENEVPKALYESGGSGDTSSTYYILSGTSMAAPMVSGTAALMLQQNPAWTPDQIKAELMKSSTKTFPQFSTYTDPATGITYTSQYDLFTVGAGYLDVRAALQSPTVAAGLAKSPVVQYDPATQSVYFVNDQFAVWGGSSPDWSSFAVWGGSAFVGGNFAVWGGSSPWASFAVWGGSAPWGSSTDSGFFAVWGGSTVQSNSTPASETLIKGDR